MVFAQLLPTLYHPCALAAKYEAFVPLSSTFAGFYRNYAHSAPSQSEAAIIKNSALCDFFISTKNGIYKFLTFIN